MSNRQFYKTIIPVEVLSEEPIGDLDIQDILFRAEQGDFSMRVLPEQQTVLNGKEAADALDAQASAPSFFGLTEDGEDCDR